MTVTNNGCADFQLKTPNIGATPHIMWGRGHCTAEMEFSKKKYK